MDPDLELKKLKRQEEGGSVRAQLLLFEWNWMAARCPAFSAKKRVGAAKLALLTIASWNQSLRDYQPEARAAVTPVGRFIDLLELLSGKDLEVLWLSKDTDESLHPFLRNLTK